MVKLTPNVTDITEMALAAESAGADAVSLINTLTGMIIDINTKDRFFAIIWAVCQVRRFFRGTSYGLANRIQG